MVAWVDFDKLESYKKLSSMTKKVDLTEVMAGEEGAARVAEYCMPMSSGLVYNYAAKQVDGEVLAAFGYPAEEAQLSEKFAALYNGEVINTGEKRLVLHQLCRGQLGDAVVADGVDKRAFYAEQQKRIAEFAAKVHAGEIVNEAGEKFTTVVQIGIGGSDLGPRAIYIALENWARKNGSLKMEAKFISNVDPDDAAAVLNSVDVAHSVFVLVSKSGTTLETLTNESFRGHQRDFPACEEQRISGSFLHGRLYRRALFLLVGSRRRGSLPGLRTGCIRALPGRRGSGRPQCRK